MLPEKLFGPNKRTQSWYKFVMKRYWFLLSSILTVFLAGCDKQALTVDMSKTVTDTNAPPVNLPAEVARAKSENKLLLLEFGSSDSCPPCVLMQQKVFSSPEFKAYEKLNLDFVHLDYPANVELRPDTKATNIALAKQFQVQGYPTFLGLNQDGKEIWREEGITLDQASPKVFIALLESAKEKRK